MSHTAGRRVRATFLMGAALLTAGSLAACSNSSVASDGEGDVKVAYIGSKGVSFQNAIFEGLSSVDGINATFIESGFDVTKQTQAIQNAVASGKYDGIVVLPNSGTGIVGAVNQAINAGIAVVNVDSPLGPDPDSTEPQIEGQAGAVVTDWESIGFQATNLAIQACKENGINGCTVARVGGLAQYTMEAAVDRGVARAVEESGIDVKVVPTIFAGGYDANSGLKAAQDLIAANPDVDVIMASDPVMRGVERGISGSKAILVGFSGTKYGMKQVVEGKYYGEVALFPLHEGEVAGESILKHVADPDAAADNLPAVPEGQAQSFTRENAGSFAGEYE